MRAAKITAYGRTITFAHGMTVETSSRHVEWLDELQRRAKAHDDLLAALESIANGEGYYGDQAAEYKAIARAAIAKATGG